MKILFCLIGLICMSYHFAYSDEVYLRNGQVLRNCHVVDTTNSRVRIVATGIERLIPLVSINKIVFSSYDPDKPTIVQNQDGSFQNLDTAKVTIHEENPPVAVIPHHVVPEVKTTYPNLYLLPMSFVALGLAWDYFEDVSQLSESIDSYKKLNFNTSKLESAKNRKVLLGITFLAAGVINTVFAFKTVEVKASSGSLGLIYHF